MKHVDNSGDTHPTPQSSRLHADTAEQSLNRRGPPTTHIRRPGRMAALNLGEILQYGELMKMLIIRQLKIRYRQTALGVLWVVLQPLLLMAVFALLFSRVPRMAAEGVPYTLFIFAGLVPWQLFARVYGEGTRCLLSEKGLLSKVYFPRLIVPLVVVIVAFIDLAVPLFVVFLLAITFAFDSLSWNLIYLPLFLLLEGVFALGVILWTAPLNVRYRDVGMLVPFTTMLLMFSSPVIFQLDFLGPRLKEILSINPLATILEGVRWSFYGTPFEFTWLRGLSVLIVIAIFISGLFIFKKSESDFTDNF